MAAGSSRPQMLMCYLCGREFGTKSLPIHIPQCEKKWLAREAAKPKSEQKPLPKRPERLNEAMVGASVRNKAGFNEEMYSNWDNEVLDKCQWCGRTFTSSAMKSHAKSCTQENPAKPAGTGLTKASLSSTLGGKVSGTRQVAGGSSSSLEAPPKVASHLDFETITGAPRRLLEDLAGGSHITSPGKAYLQRPKSRDVKQRPHSSRRPDKGATLAKRQSSRELKKTTPATAGSPQRPAAKSAEAQDAPRKGFYGNVLEERSSSAAGYSISRPMFDKSSSRGADNSNSFAVGSSCDLDARQSDNLGNFTEIPGAAGGSISHATGASSDLDSGETDNLRPPTEVPPVQIWSGAQEADPPPSEAKLANFCQECGARFVETAKYCHECGSPRPGVSLHIQHKFCHHCGHSVG